KQRPRSRRGAAVWQRRFHNAKVGPEAGFSRLPRRPERGPMLLERLTKRFGTEILQAQEAHGAECIAVARDRAPELLKALRDEAGFAFDMLADLSAVDWLGRKPRFDVVYHLNSLKLHHRLCVKVQVDMADLWVGSVIGIWKAADWLERECYDMFGIEFHGHGD